MNIDGNINILQINVGRDKKAQDILYETARKNNIDIIIISEPNKKMTKAQKWITDKSTDTAIIVNNKELNIYDSGNCRGACWIELREIIIYSTYLSPNILMEEYEQILDTISDSLAKQSKPKLIGGDFNAKSHLWNEKREDQHGRIVVDWMAQHNLIIANKGVTSTFSRGASESIIDLTMTTDDIADKIEKWRVLEEESLSLHKYLIYELKTTKSKAVNRETSDRGWKTKGMDKEKLIGTFKELVSNAKEDNKMNPENITRIITEACDMSLRKRGKSNNKKPIYWWNETIARARKVCLEKKRKWTRINKRKDSTESEKLINKEEYKVAKKKLKTEIYEAKKRSWNKIIKELENDIWGQAYKIVARQSRSKPQYRLSDEVQMEEAKKLFLERDQPKWKRIIIKEEEVLPFETDEIKTAIKKLKNGKAPGLDNITTEILKPLIEEEMNIFKEIFNQIIKTGNIPKSWKESQLLLIEKGKKGKKKDNPTGPYRW